MFKAIKTEKKIVLFLLFLSPAMGELLSGSAPPPEFFHPLMLPILVLLYGCGTLLIREARARWGLQWCVVLLAVAYGIIEEGLMVKSFFNPNWVDLGDLSGYGEYLGVQWVWTIMLTAYHATISTLIPIAITESLWPRHKNVSLLGGRGLKLTFTGFILVTVFGMIFFGTEQNGDMTPYYPNPLLLVGSFVIVLILVWLAYRYRTSRISTSSMPLLPPLILGIGAFIFQALNIFVPNALATNDVPGTTALAVQLVGRVLVLLLIIYQLWHRDLMLRHIVALVSGSVTFFLIFGTIAGFASGMLAVGIIGLILLIRWRRVVLRDLVNKPERAE